MHMLSKKLQRNEQFHKLLGESKTSQPLQKLIPTKLQIHETFTGYLTSRNLSYRYSMKYKIRNDKYSRLLSAVLVCPGKIENNPSSQKKGIG